MDERRGPGEAAAAKTHDTADWLTGGGSVTVSGTVTTPVWKRAVDGNWADAANWHGPAPTAGCVPDVAAPGSFVITFRGTDPTPGALTLGGVGCQVTLRLSGEVSWTSGTFDVSHGGTIEVPSGTSLFCRDNPAFTVSGGVGVPLARDANRRLRPKGPSARRQFAITRLCHFEFAKSPSRPMATGLWRNSSP